MTSLVRRYFLCGDLLAVIYALVVTGVVAVVVLLTIGHVSGWSAVPVGLILYLVAAGAGWLVLRRPSKGERATGSARPPTGFARVRTTRQLLTQGSPLDSDAQAVADALADMVQSRSRAARATTRVAAVLVAFFVALLVFGLDSQDGNTVLGAVSSLVVVAVVVTAERRRIAAIRRELLAGSAG